MKDPEWAKKKARQKTTIKEIGRLARLGESPFTIQQKTGAEETHIAKYGAPLALCETCGRIAIEIYHRKWICESCYVPDNLDRNQILMFYLARQNCALGLYVAKSRYGETARDRRRR